MQYATQTYQPEPNAPVKILSAKPSVSQSDVIVLALYAALAPKEPHLSFFILQLPSLQLARLRIDVPLSPDEYQQCLQQPNSVFFSVTPLVPAIESDYVLLWFFGRIRCFSLTSV